MTKANYALVDSNIIIDIVQRDSAWLKWSVDALTQAEEVRVNPIIYSELCYQKTSAEEVDKILAILEIGYEELPRSALYLASQAYRQYRKLGGTKNSPLPDFFIGAHAAVLGIPILTRDVARYRNYFPSVELICP